VLLAFPLPDTSLSWQQILANATMLPYYLRAEYVDEVYWTLTVELAFYAFACLWRWRGWLQAPEPFIAVWLGVELLATWLEAYVRPVPAVIATAMLLQYGHFFFAGVLFHQIRQHGFTALRGCLLVACIMVAWVVRDAPHAFALLISSVIFVALIKGWLRCLAVRPLLFCGAISYPLYLLHERVGFVMIHQLRAAGCTSDVWLLAPVVTMVPLAWAIHALVEDPAQLWLRDRWKHSALRARLQLARRR
jgi:peptidoglycan/LPS O-acetylase OafA/YrhL